MSNEHLSKAQLCQQVWLVRHGETAANVDRVIQGQSAVPLNARGVAQAEALSKWIAALPSAHTFGPIITSPLIRARHTAEIVAGTVGRALVEDARWMERGFGEWEGRPADAAFAALDTDPAGPMHARPPGGESLWDLAQRVQEAFAHVGAREDLGARVLVVTHGGPIAAAVCAVLGLEYSVEKIRSFKRDNTGITVFTRRRGSGFALASLNERPHLPDPWGA